MVHGFACIWGNPVVWDNRMKKEWIFRRMKIFRGWMAPVLAAVLFMTGCGESRQPESSHLDEEKEIAERPEEAFLQNPEQEEPAEDTSDMDQQEKEEILEKGQLPFGSAARYEWIDRESEVLSGYELPLPDDFYLSLVSYSCDGLYIKDEDHERLNAALAENNRHTWEAMYESRYGMGEMLEAFLRDSGEYALAYFPWSYENTARVSRADDRVFSFSRNGYTYLGGAHPSAELVGYSYDTKSGRALLISDVVTDQEEFCKRVNQRLHENQDLENGGYENWQEIADEALKNPEKTNFCFTETGLQVIFPVYLLGPYAMGDIIAELSYEELSDIMKEAYLPAGRQTCLRLEPYESVSLDLDGDGEEESIQVSYEEEWDQEYDYCMGIATTVSVTKNGEERTVTDELGLDYCDSYLMENAEGEFYVYVETASENDWHNIAVIEVGGSEGPVMKGYADAGGFYEMRPFDAQDFYLEHILHVMGTWSGFCSYRVGKDGFPEATEEAYRLWPVKEAELFLEEEGENESFGRLTLLQDLEADFHETPDDRDRSSRKLLPAGSVLVPCRTDGEMWMMFRTEEGAYVDLYYDEADPDTWERTINGISELSLLEGIFYAG